MFEAEHRTTEATGQGKFVLSNPMFSASSRWKRAGTQGADPDTTHAELIL